MTDHPDKFNDQADDFGPDDESDELPPWEASSDANDDEWLDHEIVLDFVPTEFTDDPQAWAEFSDRIPDLIDELVRKLSAENEENYVDPEPTTDREDNPTLSMNVDGTVQEALDENRREFPDVTAAEVGAAMKLASSKLTKYLSGRMKAGWKFVVQRVERVERIGKAAFGGDDARGESSTGQDD